MSFLSSFALFAIVLAAVPLFAHLLRRQRAREVVLPTAKLLAASLPEARKRSALEDRLLLSLRVLAIAALVMLGATPFVQCSHLALNRKDGASIALVFVIDDSLSMRAPMPGGETRLEAARKAALELLDASTEGDSFAIVLAGRPVRVELAPTLDKASAASALAALQPSDRATDLSFALESARALLERQPQADKRIVLLSDLADGASSDRLASEGAVLWYPVPELRADETSYDCAVISAEQHGAAVEVNTRCVGSSEQQREVVVHEAGKPDAVVARAPLPKDGNTVTLKLPSAQSSTELDVRLVPADIIGADDAAPVLFENNEFRLGVMVDTEGSKIETGGPSPVEQALAALDSGASIRALSAIPSQEELASLKGLVLDDPAGLAPEDRAALIEWVEAGGFLLVTLSRDAESASLAATFGTLVPGVLRLDNAPPKGANVARCSVFGESAQSLDDVRPTSRVRLELPLFRDAEMLCEWSDGAPLVLRRALGRGAVTVVTTSFRLEESELPLRPAFLSLLDGFVATAKESHGMGVVTVGQPLTFKAPADGPGQLVATATGLKSELPRATPGTALPTELIGRYTFVTADKSSQRIALVADVELDFRARPLVEGTNDAALGGRARDRDISAFVAFLLLALLLVESAVRTFTPPASQADKSPVV